MAGESLADDLRRFIAELTSRIDDRETSVPGEDSPFGPVRGTPLYEAAKTVERHYPGGKLPPAAWDFWTRLIIRADKDKGEADPDERTIACYRFAAKLRRWAITEMKKTTGKPALRVVKASVNARMIDVLSKTPEAVGWSKTAWSKHLNCSRTAIQYAPAWEQIMASRAEAKRDQQARARKKWDR